MHWGLVVSKLRWTLLILGGVFILALALWERWRPRQARGRGAKGRAGTQDAWVCETPGHEAASSAGKRGPAAMDGQSDDPTSEGRAGTQDAWVCETFGYEAAGGAGQDAAAMDGRSEDPTGQPRAAGRDAPAQSLSGDESATVPTAEGGWSGEERIGEVSGERIDASFPGGFRADPAEPWIGEPGLAEAASPESGTGRDARRVVIAGSPDESPTAELPVLTEAVVDAPAPQALEETVALEGLAPAEPIVRWPPEALRQVVALRLVAPPERFPGRAVRLALGAEGFLLGKFDIFHKPDQGRRAVVSAASLTRPGTFDLDTMDSQRYPGLSLFVVLPGPRPGQQAFDELVDVAQNLCERLQGELQDAQGEALTDESIQTLRAALTASAGGETVS